MAENGVRPPDPPPNGNRQDGQPNGHRETPIARQDDVFLDIPKLQVDKIEVNVANLRARVSLNAEVLSLLKLSVGLDAAIDEVHLEIQGVEAQAQLKVHLENVAHIIDSVLGTIDAHPEIITPLVENAGQAIGAAGRGIESAVTDTGRGAGEAVREVGSGAGGAVREVGSGAGGAVREVGSGAGGAVRDVGGGAGEATREVGRGAGEATRDVGAGAGEATGQVGAGAGEATGQVGAGAGEAAGRAGAGVSETVDDVGSTAGKAAGDVTDVVEETDAGSAADDLGGKAREAGKQVTDHAAEAESEDSDEPDISAQSTVAADREEQRGNGKRPPRKAGLPRRKPRRWY